MNQTETELERFRQQWRQEVTARHHRGGVRPYRSSRRHQGQELSEAPGNVILTRTKPLHPSNLIQDDVLEPRTFHDIEEKQESRKLGEESSSREDPREPQTALEHYEKGVERERQGNLGESVGHYRKAFKLDAKVQEKYKQKNPIAAPATSTSAASKSLPASMAELISSFSDLTILPSEPPTEMSPLPPCPISLIPDEILVQILADVAVQDPASFVRLAPVCKRLAYLVLTEDGIWRRIVHGPEFGLAGMHYEFAKSVTWRSLPQTLDQELSLPLDNRLLLSPKYPTYLSMFRSRPRLRFGGCYICCINYTRNGMFGGHSLSWETSPVLIVTYYRYLRFYRDGTVISLLTTSEPADVVGVLHKQNVRDDGVVKSHHRFADPDGFSQPRVMRQAQKGRWRLTGDPFERRSQQPVQDASETQGTEQETEEEGDVIIETEGVNENYIYKMHLGISSAGRGTRNNKLAWKGYWSYNKQKDDWSEFLLRHERPYFWSRVKSYGMELIDGKP